MKFELHQPLRNPLPEGLAVGIESTKTVPVLSLPGSFSPHRLALALSPAPLVVETVQLFEATQHSWLPEWELVDHHSRQNRYS